MIVVALGFKFFTKGLASSAAVLLGLVAGYVVGIFTGAVNFGAVSKAAWFALPEPFKYGIEFQAFAIFGMCLISIISAIETVGDISAIAKGGANREATDKERQAVPMPMGWAVRSPGFLAACPTPHSARMSG